MKRRLLLFVVCATGLVAVGSVPLASSPAFDLGVDTTGPAFAFAECGASAGLTYRTGDTVTVVRPDETLATLVSAAGENGVYAWTKPLAGGVYTLTNSGEEGSVIASLFTVKSEPVKKVPTAVPTRNGAKQPLTIRAVRNPFTPSRFPFLCWNS